MASTKRIIVTTARSGDALRRYAEQNADKPRVAIFPEQGLSPEEQAAFLAQHGEGYDEVITFSPFIVSDAARDALNILDLSREEATKLNIKHGDSINRITKGLWRPSTIGGLAQSRIDSYRDTLEKTRSVEQIDDLIDTAYRELGDSVERILLIDQAIKKCEALATESPKQSLKG